MTSFSPPGRLDYGFAEQRQTYLLALIYMLLSFLVLMGHAFLGAYLGLPGFVFFVVATVIGLFTRAELACALIFSTLFLQNVFIAIVAPQIHNFDHFNALQATNFLSTVLSAMFCVPVWMKLRNSLPEDSRKILRWMFFLFIVIVLYSIFGLAQASVSSVLTYTRVYLVGCMLLAIGVVFGLQISVGFAVSTVRILSVILVVWGFAEFFFAHTMYDIFNLPEFLRLKYTNPYGIKYFESVNDVVRFSSRAYLNLSGMLGLDKELLRPNGPNMHPISFAYYLAFCGLMCFIYRASFLVIACFLLLLVIGAKGPLIMVIAALALYGVYAFTNSYHTLKVASFGFAILYTLVGLGYGVYTNDYHVIGFFGGVKSLFTMPVGHGIGVGGSISTMGQNAELTDYQSFQKFGASYAFDSAVGVMFYQIGWCSIIFFIFCKHLWKSVQAAVVQRLAMEPRLALVPVILVLLVVNGIFQEEALSPAGWGPWMLFSGFLLTRYWRDKPIEPVTTQNTLPTQPVFQQNAFDLEKSKNMWKAARKNLKKKKK